MVDQIEKIRHLMSEQRYIEAQQLIEKSLLYKSDQELLGIYLEIHLLQGISLPYDQTIEFIHHNKDLHLSLGLLKQLSVTIESQLSEIKIYQELGELNHLHRKISEFYVYLYERKIPRRFDEITKIRKQFFADDFNLELKELALQLDLGWHKLAEEELRKLIVGSFQKPSVRNRVDRFTKIEKVLSGFGFNTSAKIYSHYLQLFVHGIREKSDYKKIIEVILYFEELEFKAIILNLISGLGLDVIAQKYADNIKDQKDYKFVYFEKYHPDLKRFFVKPKADESKDVMTTQETDLSLEEWTSPEEESTEWVDDSVLTSDLELAESLKHLEYDVTGWLNLAASFLQAEFNKSALFCARKVKAIASTDVDFLKGSYLAIHAMMKLQDYRMALDCCYEALEKSTSENDLLSFYYLEAEVLIKLKEKSSAKKVLDKILSIDSSYRLSSKMLKRLDEI